MDLPKLCSKVRNNESSTRGSKLLHALMLTQRAYWPKRSQFGFKCYKSKVYRHSL